MLDRATAHVPVNLEFQVSVLVEGKLKTFHIPAELAADGETAVACSLALLKDLSEKSGRGYLPPMRRITEPISSGVARGKANQTLCLGLGRRLFRGFRRPRTRSFPGARTRG